MTDLLKTTQTDPSQHSGRCLCGGVQLRIAGPMRPIIYCHCSQCRRWTGHYLAATAARRGQVTITDRAGLLRWYESSPGYRRGFCSACGSPLLWGRDGGGFWSIPAGVLDRTDDLPGAMHIFAEHKGDYYTIQDEDAPVLTNAQSSTPEIEAWRAASRAWR